jgi:hypothetical protein
MAAAAHLAEQRSDPNFAATIEQRLQRRAALEPSRAPRRPKNWHVLRRLKEQVELP